MCAAHFTKGYFLNLGVACQQCTKAVSIKRGNSNFARTVWHFWLTVCKYVFLSTFSNPGILAKICLLASDHHGLLIIPIHWLASLLCLLSTSKLVWIGHPGAIWLPSSHPCGCCTLVVVEEIPPHIVKCFECLEKRYINQLIMIVILLLIKEFATDYSNVSFELCRVVLVVCRFSDHKCRHGIVYATQCNATCKKRV